MSSNFISSRFQKYIVVSINAALGILLWLDYFTNYSFLGKYSEFWFPLLTGIIGFISYKFLAKKDLERWERSVYNLTSVPSVVGGILSLILIFPPMCLFSLTFLSNISLERQVHYKVSPDGLQVAKVYQGYAGLANTQSRCSIRVSPRGFPFIEREVFVDVSELPAWCEKSVNNHIEWKNKNTILIPESMKEVKTDTIKFATPYWLIEIVLAFSWFSAIFPK